jgi:hypothetical protein
MVVKRFPKGLASGFGEKLRIGRQGGSADHFFNALKQSGFEGLQVGAGNGLSRIMHVAYASCLQYAIAGMRQ